MISGDLQIIRYEIYEMVFYCKRNNSIVWYKNSLVIKFSGFYFCCKFDTCLIQTHCSSHGNDKHSYRFFYQQKNQKYERFFSLKKKTCGGNLLFLHVMCSVLCVFEEVLYLFHVHTDLHCEYF